MDQERAMQVADALSEVLDDSSGLYPDGVGIIAAALAAEREDERLQWNPMVGRVIQVTQEWHQSEDRVLRACAEKIHAAVAGKP